MDSLITASARALAKAEDCRLGGLYCLRDDSSRLGFDPHSLSPHEINTAKSIWQSISWGCSE